LKFYNLPTNLVDLSASKMIEMLLNDKAGNLADLTIHRSRQAEIVFNLIYKNILMAHNDYAARANFGDEKAKLFLVEDYVIKSLLGAHPHNRGNSALTLSNTFNPIMELKDDTKVIKSGPGGVPDKRSFKSQHRNTHPSQMGQLGANSTTELIASSFMQ